MTINLYNAILRVLKRDPLFLYIKVKTMQITIYTNEGCIWCTRTKELFARANVEYSEVNWSNLSVDEQLEVKQKYSNNIRAFPVVVIDDEFVGGLIETAKIFLKKGLVTSGS